MQNSFRFHPNTSLIQGSIEIFIALHLHYPDDTKKSSVDHSCLKNSPNLMRYMSLSGPFCCHQLFGAAEISLQAASQWHKPHLLTSHIAKNKFCPEMCSRKARAGLNDVFRGSSCLIFQSIESWNSKQDQSTCDFLKIGLCSGSHHF